MRKLLLGCALAALAAPAVHAQETTSSIRGTVTSAGAPVANATVGVVHVPSGTRSTAVTDASGGFQANGLRVGGPYTVTVTASGFKDTQITDIQALVGQPTQLPVDLVANDATGGEIVVTATRVGARSVSQGPATVLTAEKIATIASVNRDIRDLMRRDPFATLDTSQSTGRTVTFAGQNPRFNRFTIDGVPITDNFGLNPDGLPSRRGPVPLDSIGQFQTKVAPYDVREGFFQGGVINAILRSGNNEFQGTGFYSYSADELVGDRTRNYILNPTGRVPQPNFKDQDYGAEISGPIVRDRLFFMVSAERVRASRPVTFGTVDDNAGTPVTNLSSATVATIQQISQSRYGFDPGGILRNNQDKDDRIVGKIDANLSDTQRFALTGIYTKDSLSVPTTTGNTSLGLESNAYTKPDRVYAGIGQLNSEWSSNFTTEARLLYKDYRSGQFPLRGVQSQFSICTAQASDRAATATGDVTTNASLSCPANTPQVVLGAGGPSQANILTSRTYGGSFVARLTMNDHNLRLLADIQRTKIFNEFVNNFAGSYYFDSLNDFAAGNAQQLTYQNAVPSLDPVNASARFTYQTYTFGIQDDWRVGSTLNVSYGARYDVFGGHTFPATNPFFVARYGFSNSEYINGRGLFQPRIGFDFTPVRRLVIRGGGGIFGGGTPDVYIGNSFSQTGVLANTLTARVTDGNVYQINGTANPAAGMAVLNNVNINAVNPAANAALTSATVAATTTTNSLDPHFKIPSQWRATLSATYKADLGRLGDGWVFGVDGFYSKVRDQVLVTDLRSVPIVGTGATTPDGRQRYRGLISNADTGADYQLTDTKKGRSLVGVVRFDHAWDFGLDVNGSFTYQNVKDQSPLTSSQASSLYGNSANFDANRPAYGHSNDEVKYSFKYNVSFDHAFFGDYKTRLDFFGETRIGSPYSYTFQDLSSGRSGTFGTVGTNSRYLFYVPTGPNDPLVGYDSIATRDYIDNLISSTGLSKYRGKVAPRNGFRSKWFTKIDLHLEQQIPTFVGKSRISLFVDIENFSNLLNHKWGQQLRSFFPYNKVVARVTCGAVGANPCGQYLYSQPSSAATLADQLITVNGSSLYSIRVGARFTF